MSSLDLKCARKTVFDTCEMPWNFSFQALSIDCFRACCESALGDHPVHATFIRRQQGSPVLLALLPGSLVSCIILALLDSSLASSEQDPESLIYPVLSFD